MTPALLQAGSSIAFPLLVRLLCLLRDQERDFLLMLPFLGLGKRPIGPEGQAT